MAKATIRTGDVNVSGQAVSPSSQVAAASGLKHEKDSRGRLIGVVKPSVLDRYRVLKMLGGETAGNQHALGYAMLACAVREIDGQPVPMPNTERQIEALIDRLGDEGFEAVGQCLSTHFGMVGEEDREETLRNLSETQA